MNKDSTKIMAQQIRELEAQNRALREMMGSLYLTRNSICNSGPAELYAEFGLIQDEGGYEVDWLDVCKFISRRLGGIK